MSRTRQWTAVGIVGVLALALVGLLWRSQNTAAPTTTILASPTTTALAAVTTTTSVAATLSPTTTSAEQRLAEVELILTDLWFGWFDGIYRKDADALWQVVATTSSHQAGVRAMDQLSFDEPPSLDVLEVRVNEILLDRANCLVVDNGISVPFLAGDPSETGVNVLWPDAVRGWRFATAWVYPGDMWLADCDEVSREETP